MSSIQFQPRNVLITGGAGFIGSNFIRYLLDHDQDVRLFNLDSLTYAGLLDNLKDLNHATRHTFIQGNICDFQLVSMILREHAIDTIVHFAAESHVDRSISGPKPFIESNLVGTFTLLEAARLYWLNERKWDAIHCRFHHISTDEVYGSLNKNDLPFTEQSRYAPNSPYSATKAGSDHLARAYWNTYGLPLTMSNCSNNYGPYQHPEKLIPTIIHSCLSNTLIPIYGDGSNIRDWLYVEDHCKGILDILKRGRTGESYNLGGDNEITNLQMAKTICQLMDKIVPRSYSYENLIQFVTDRLGHDFRYAIDSTKIMKELNWHPQVSFESGLQKTIQFYIKLHDAVVNCEEITLTTIE